MKTPQEQVAENTAARGYRDGWTAEQFAARQVCKITDGLGNLTANIWSTSEYDNVAFWERLINIASVDALSHLNDKTRWSSASVSVFNSTKRTLAYIQIAIFNLAAALAEITGEPFDVVQAAVDKSAADIERGKR